jgi:hypothetical protein
MSMKGPKPPGETRAQKTNVNIATESHKLSREIAPVRDDLFKRISDFRQEAAQVKNVSSNDAAMAFDGADAAASAAAARSPLAIPAMALRRGTAQAGQAVSTDMATRSAAVRGTQALTDMAMGERESAMEGVQDLAARQGREAVMRARSDAAQQNQRIDAAAGLVGGGLALYKRKPMPTSTVTGE